MTPQNCKCCAILVGVCAIVWPVPAARGEIIRGGTAAALFTYDFEEWSAYAGPSGTAFISLGNEDLGILFGEKLVGQTVTMNGESDVISGTPAVPLVVDTSISAAFGVNVLTFFSSTVIDGLGGVGFPSPSAIGDGAVTVLFNADQHLVGFDLRGTNRGTIRVQFFGRDGSLLGDHVVSNITDSTCVFSSTNPTPDIAALTITNTDMGGLGFDNFLFHPTFLDGEPVCLLPDTLEAARQGSRTTVQLAAGLRLEELEPWHYFYWVTDCPNPLFSNPTHLQPTLSFETTGCATTCTASLIVDDGLETDVCTTQITVIDSAGGGGGAILFCPEDQTVESDGAGNLADYEAWLASAFTDRPDDLTVHFGEPQPGCGNTGAITVTWRVGTGEGSGDCGAGAECSATFSIEDKTPPVLSVDTTPISIKDPFCIGRAKVALPAASATDNDDSAPELTCDAPEIFEPGLTTVTWTASDACGNAGSASMDVTVHYGAGVEVTVTEHIVGPARRGGLRKIPMEGVRVSAFDISRSSCAREFNRSTRAPLRRELEALLARCPATNAADTDASGVAAIGLPAGRYVVVAEIDADGDGTTDDYLLHHTGQIECGEWKSRQLPWCRPATNGRLTGGR